MVSQRPLHLSQSLSFKGSHLSCARNPTAQCQPTVKLHRVFSSYRDSPGIFTWSAISPGLASRQYPHRDTIRAGRNFKVLFLSVVSREPQPRSGRTYPADNRQREFFSGETNFSPPASLQGSDYIISAALKCAEHGV